MRSGSERAGRAALRAVAWVCCFTLPFAAHAERSAPAIPGIAYGYVMLAAVIVGLMRYYFADHRTSDEALMAGLDAAGPKPYDGKPLDRPLNDGESYTDPCPPSRRWRELDQTKTRLAIIFFILTLLAVKIGTFSPHLPERTGALFVLTLGLLMLGKMQIYIEHLRTTRTQDAPFWQRQCVDDEDSSSPHWYSIEPSDRIARSTAIIYGFWFFTFFIVSVLLIACYWGDGKPG